MSCCCSVTQSCLTLCDPMDCSTPALPVPHHLPKFTQVHVHCIGNAIQTSHPLVPSSPSAFNLSQHQCLFQWVSCSQLVTRYWSFRFNNSPSNEYSGLISFRMDWLISLLSKGLSGVFSSTTVWKHQFFGALPSSQSSSHDPNVTTGNAIALTIWTFVRKVMFLLFNTLSRLVRAFICQEAIIF